MRWANDDKEVTGMNRGEILAYIESNVDLKYRDFHSKLVPNTNDIRGVRLPILRNLAKRIVSGDPKIYFENVSYDSYEERMLCGLVIGNLKGDFLSLKPYLTEFIPHIDNWAVCDCFCASLKVTNKHKKEMLNYLLPYLSSDRVYEVRFAIVMLMNYYIDSQHIGLLLSTFERVKNED